MVLISKKMNQNILGPNFFDSKLTRLLHLISFAYFLPQCHASRETSHHICPTEIRLHQPKIKAYNIPFWFDIKQVNFNLVTNAIFLNVSQNFNDIPQENEAVLWDVNRSEKLLEDAWRKGNTLMRGWNKPLTLLETSDSWLRFRPVTSRLKPPLRWNQHQRDTRVLPRSSASLLILHFGPTFTGGRHGFDGVIKATKTGNAKRGRETHHARPIKGNKGSLWLFPQYWHKGNSKDPKEGLRWQICSLVIWQYFHNTRSLRGPDF